MTREQIAAIINLGRELEHYAIVRGARRMQLEGAWIGGKPVAASDVVCSMQRCAAYPHYPRATAEDVDRALSERWTLLQGMRDQYNAIGKEWDEETRFRFWERIEAHQKVLDANVACAGDALDDAAVIAHMDAVRSERDKREHYGL